MLLSAQCEWCPGVVQPSVSGEGEALQVDSRWGDKNRNEYGVLVGQGGGELVSSGNDLTRENGK